ncbi:permease [Roseofilum sp. BLCC_M154]|uniref:Permease n=1 Tax=Roseofilum acuticapitatum BLCC-M154 TaxID=3022444 RepID=A0ABT7AUU7_9CYAN|nr:permease [Roseofilum acuticapitatum]MDJ1170686.1 permease [Roseofilum acuticapitatum BLCC-M154]
MNQFNTAFTIFLSLIVEAFPFLLLGVMLSSALLFFVDERKLLRLIPKQPLLGALAGSAIGFLFPVCECGNVPVARRFLLQGFPPSVAVGFLLAAPTINPVVIWSTWTAFRDQPELVIFRVIFSLLIATGIAWIFSSQADLRPLLQPGMVRLMPDPSKDSAVDEEKDESLSLLQPGNFLIGNDGKRVKLDVSMGETPQLFQDLVKQPWSYRWRLFMDNALQELRELGGVLVIGSAIAALIQVGMPRDLILAVGTGPVTSILAMMILGAVVSICSTVDAFFALSFASTFTSASLLAFLVFGPMIDIKSVGLMLSMFKPRPIIYLLVLAAQLTFVLTFLYHMVD